MRASSVVIAAFFVGCAGGSSKPPSDPPPPERAFSRPAPDPAAAVADFAKHARTKGCQVEELSTGALAHCPEAMIAVEPRANAIQIECREMSPTDCGPIFDAILNAGVAPPASASIAPSASASPAPSASAP
ncbi:MAG: hypothetical protein ACXVEF_18795 [Polyangiales bacterium]